MLNIDNLGLCLIYRKIYLLIALFVLINKKRLLLAFVRVLKREIILVLNRHWLHLIAVNAILVTIVRV